MEKYTTELYEQRQHVGVSCANGHVGHNLATKPASKIPTNNRHTMRLEKLFTAAVQIDAVPKPRSMPGIPYFPDSLLETMLPTGPKRIMAM